MGNAMQLRMLCTVWLVVACVCPAAHAVAPFVTEDARILDPGGYQIEAVVQDQHGERATEYAIFPSHNFGGALERFEFGLGAGIVHTPSASNSNVLSAPVKGLLLPLAEQGVGFAFLAGVNRVKPGLEIPDSDLEPAEPGST